MDDQLSSGYWVSITLEPSVKHFTISVNEICSIFKTKPEKGSYHELPMLGGKLYAAAPDNTTILSTDDSFVMYLEQPIFTTTATARAIDEICKGINLVDKSETIDTWSGQTFERLVLIAK